MADLIDTVQNGQQVWCPLTTGDTAVHKCFQFRRIETFSTGLPDYRSNNCPNFL